MNVPFVAVAVGHLAQQKAASIANARIVDAELVAAIDHCQGLRSGKRFVAGKILRKFGPLRFGGIETDQLRRLGVEIDQIGVRHRVGGFGLEKLLPQLDKRVGEIELFQRIQVQTSKRFICNDSGGF